MRIMSLPRAEFSLPPQIRPELGGAAKSESEQRKSVAQDILLESEQGKVNVLALSICGAVLRSTGTRGDVTAARVCTADHVVNH